MFPDFTNNVVDITGKFVINIKVGAIGFLGVLVPLAGEGAMTTVGFKPLAESANTGEQVDKGEISVFGRGFVQMEIQLFQYDQITL